MIQTKTPILGLRLYLQRPCAAASEAFRYEATLIIGSSYTAPVGAEVTEVSKNAFQFTRSSWFDSFTCNVQLYSVWSLIFSLKKYYICANFSRTVVNNDTRALRYEKD